MELGWVGLLWIGGISGGLARSLGPTSGRADCSFTSCYATLCLHGSALAQSAVTSCPSWLSLTRPGGLRRGLLRRHRRPPPGPHRWRATTHITSAAATRSSAPRRAPRANARWPPCCTGPLEHTLEGQSSPAPSPRERERRRGEGQGSPDRPRSREGRVRRRRGRISGRSGGCAVLQWLTGPCVPPLGGRVDAWGWLGRSLQPRTRGQRGESPAAARLCAAAARAMRGGRAGPRGGAGPARRVARDGAAKRGGEGSVAVPGVWRERPSSLPGASPQPLS